MKKIFYYLFASAMLLAVGCNEDEPTLTPQPDEAIGLEAIDYAADSNKVAISYTVSPTNFSHRCTICRRNRHSFGNQQPTRTI